MGDGFLIAMWLYGGFEKLTVSAEEVENPARAFPIALAFAVPMCALSYFVPTFAALVANGRLARLGRVVLHRGGGQGRGAPPGNRRWPPEVWRPTPASCW